MPSLKPSLKPSSEPSLKPSSQPSSEPSPEPSAVPSLVPSSTPSLLPSLEPSLEPSSQPSTVPTSVPSLEPSYVPSSLPSLEPSLKPSSVPSLLPSVIPSSEPSNVPSLDPSSKPSSVPSLVPSLVPSSEPSLLPSLEPSSTSIPTSTPSLLPSPQPSVTPLKVVLSVEIRGTCDCDSGVASGVSNGLSNTQIPGAKVGNVETACTAKCASGAVIRGADDALALTFELSLFVEEVSLVPFDSNAAFAEIAESTESIVQQVAQDTGIELVPSPVVVASNDDTSLSSILPFDSTPRNFCMQVMNFKANSVFKMRPCESEIGNKRQKQLWSFDNTGQIRNKARPEWCMTWAGGKQKDLRLGLCDYSPRKTAKFKYDEAEKALFVENVINNKKFKIGFNTVTKYEKLRLYGLKSENYSVNSFVLLTS